MWSLILDTVHKNVSKPVVFDADSDSFWAFVEPSVLAALICAITLNRHEEFNRG